MYFLIAYQVAGIAKNFKRYPSKIGTNRIKQDIFRSRGWHLVTMRIFGAILVTEPFLKQLN